MGPAFTPTPPVTRGWPPAARATCSPVSLSALIAQGWSRSTPPAWGSIAHGLAGDIARDQNGVVGLISGDIVDSLADAWAPPGPVAVPVITDCKIAKEREFSEFAILQFANDESSPKRGQTANRRLTLFAAVNREDRLGE